MVSQRRQQRQGREMNTITYSRSHDGAGRQEQWEQAYPFSLLFLSVTSDSVLDLILASSDDFPRSSHHRYGTNPYIPSGTLLASNRMTAAPQLYLS